MGVAQQKNKDVVFPKRGKKVNFEFESAVLARCMELVVSKALQSSETLPTDDGKPAFTAEVLASVLYKYDVVVLAAQEELKEKRWDTDDAVKKCVILLSQLCDLLFLLAIFKKKKNLLTCTAFTDYA